MAPEFLDYDERKRPRKQAGAFLLPETSNPNNRR
jgi:hypothetical protein